MNKLWKPAHVTAVHEKWPRDEAQHYRPLAWPVFAVMERIVNKKVRQHLTHNHLLCPQQHGLTSARSRLTNLLTTMEDCSRNLYDKIRTDIIFLGFCRGF